MPSSEQGDNPVCLPEFLGTKHNSFVAIDRHSFILSRSSSTAVIREPARVA